MNWELLWVGVGGFLGSVSRYGIGVWTNRFWASPFPLGTFAINLLGCFLIGLFFGSWIKGYISDSLNQLLIAGFCGGFTTFSSFSYEALALIEEGKTGAWALYVGGSVLLGMLATWGGITILRIQ